MVNTKEDFKELVSNIEEQSWYKNLWLLELHD